jgi:pyridoxine 4-dehydrogenase
MQTFALGTYEVSRMGFGAMQLPGPGVFGPPRDRDEAVAVLRRGVELGANHIDTAQYYGPNVANELIREALHPYPADLALVSKVAVRRDATGAWLPYNDPDQLRAGIEDNLRSLGVDQLAAVNLRLGDGPLPPDPVPEQRFDDQLGAMIAPREDGLIAGIGLSNITGAHLLHALKSTEIVCVQNPFNVVDHSSLAVLFESNAREIAFVPFSPLGSGFSQPNPVLTNAQLQAVATRLGHTPAQIALAWLLTTTPNVLLIPGTSSLVHLEQNMAAADIVLDEPTQQQLDGLAA